MSLFALQAHPVPRWPIGLQASLAIATPIAVMSLAGHPAVGYHAAAGAFTVLFAAAAPTRERAKVLPFVALALVLCAAAGALAAPWTWLIGGGIIVVALLGAAFAYGFSLGPPGPVFFVLVFGLSGVVVAGPAVDPLPYIAAFTAGCAFAYLLAVSPLLVPRVRAVVARPVRELLPGPRFGPDARMLLLRVAIVAVVGVLLGLLVDPDRSYWIVGAGVAVIGVAADRRAAFGRGIHRLVGTIAGAGIYALLALLRPDGLWLAVLLGAMQFTIEIVVVRNYALALLIITPLVLLLTGAATGSIGELDVALERVVDTLAGAALGAASGVLHPHRPRAES